MNKKISKILIVLFSAFFLFFYFFGDNIYQDDLTEKKDLTIEQIKKFENDVKQGNEIDISDYIVKDKDYNNDITRLNGFISNIIEKGFKKIFNYLLNSINE